MKKSPQSVGQSVRKKALAPLLFFALASAGSGCATLVPGPPGDAGIRYTSNGAQGDVAAAPDRLAAISSSVLTSMGIQPTGSSQQDGARVVTGKGRVEQVTIRIEESGSGSRIEVIDGGMNDNWNQDFAAIILLQIRLQIRNAA